MTTLPRRMSDFLCTREPVVAAFKNAHLRLAGNLLSAAIEKRQFEEPDWPKVLSWASVLAQSDHDEHVELALVATVSALLTSDRDSHAAREAAAVVLESCSNAPTVSLAKERGLIEHRDERISFPALLRGHQRRLQHFVFDDYAASTVPVTDFQERIWEALSRPEDTALSAPTSAGKSFMLVRWLVESVVSGAEGSVYAYLVPSRALINQVSGNLAQTLLRYPVRPRIVTMPSLYMEDEHRSTVLVMTQERMERLFSGHKGLCLQSIVVDEAHKLGEGPRGVILQRVIDEAWARSGTCRVVLAAPHAENAEVLLPRQVSVLQRQTVDNVVTDSRPTVLQNLFWITPVPRRSALWRVTLVRSKEVGDVGEIRLDGRPITKKKRLAALAYTLGGDEGGNIVFANGPAEAEDISLLLCGHVERSGLPVSVHGEVLELARLVRDTVHPEYPLAETLKFGIGVHYGGMPEIARREQERLFDEGKIAFLVCTSTLLEGVNLPCRNLFVWGPRQGPSKPMSEHSFWNLAGRAGRWGREFAGNIFCIDVHDKGQWPLGAPARRYSQKVSHSGSGLLNSIDQFREFAESHDAGQASRDNRYFEQILGELVATRLDGREISAIGWARWSSREQIDALESILDSVIERIQAPPEILKRHRGINPLLTAGFLAYLESIQADRADAFMPMTPDMPDAVMVLSRNLALIDAHLGGSFGNEKQRNLKAKITIDWMRGLPLGRIIRTRIDYLTSVKPVKVSVEIRAVLDLIEENARYLIPKYLSCYADCVARWYRRVGRSDLAEEIADIQDMLEAGVAERTMLALVGLGLTRTSAVEIAARIPQTELSINEVITWLRGRHLEMYGVSPVIIREVNRILEATEFT